MILNWRFWWRNSISILRIGLNVLTMTLFHSVIKKRIAIDNISMELAEIVLPLSIHVSYVIYYRMRFINTYLWLGVVLKLEPETPPKSLYNSSQVPWTVGLPGVTAESSFCQSKNIHHGSAVFSRSLGDEFLPMLDQVCTGCQTVGGFGPVAGVGRRSCCSKVWRYDPITRRYEPSWECHFESCSPSAVTSGMLAFQLWRMQIKAQIFPEEVSSSKLNLGSTVWTSPRRRGSLVPTNKYYCAIVK